LSAAQTFRRLVIATFAVVVIAAGAAIGVLAGKPATAPALRTIAPGTQTIHRGTLQTPVSIPPLKP
jgi:hypothetical protein